MGLLALAIVAAGVFRRLPIPYTVLLVVIGMALSELSRWWAPLEGLQTFHLNHDLVFFVFLPALIFESAFNLDARQLIKDIAPIMVLAVPALLIATALVGIGIWWLLDVDFVVAILFGALISATDPVAVVALLKELGAPLRLTVLVEGESLLNDATAIVLVTIVLGIALSGEAPGFASFGGAILDFCWVFLGGLVIGCLFGLAVGELLYRLQSSLSAILTMSIVLAYVSFIAAEHLLHVSGVMAAGAASVTLAGLGVSRLPPGTSRAVGETWEVIALVGDSLLFLLVGLQVETAILASRIDAIAIAVGLVLVARAAVLYSMVPATTRLFSLPRVSWGERHIMWWGGLKGGLAIAIVLSIPPDLPGRDLLLDLTLGVVLFTLLVNAPTIRPLMVRLGLDTLSPDEQAELAHSTSHAMENAHASLQEFKSADLVSEEGFNRATRIVEQAFSEKTAEPSAALSQPDKLHELTRMALRIELEQAQRMFETGVISQYIHLEIRDLLQRDRDRQQTDEDAISSTTPISPFQKFEMALLRWLREQDWAAGLLARYQATRLTQRLQMSIAGIVMCESVLEMLRAAGAESSPIADVYQQRLTRRRRRVSSIRAEFPEFYREFEYQLITRAALTRALRNVQHELHHGEVGAKVFASIDARLQGALSTLETEVVALPKISISDLLVRVPLLKGLSEEAIAAVAESAKTITFLAGDVVIRRGTERRCVIHHLQRPGPGGARRFRRRGDLARRDRRRRFFW